MFGILYRYDVSELYSSYQGFDIYRKVSKTRNGRVEEFTIKGGDCDIQFDETFDNIFNAEVAIRNALRYREKSDRQLDAYAGLMLWYDNIIKSNEKWLKR